MPRPNPGPRLWWHKDRSVWYVRWFEHGKPKLRSTGTADSEQAQDILAQYITTRQRKVTGPRDPSQVRISEVLDLYGSEKATEAKSPERIGYAIDALLPYWQDNMVSEITDAACRKYMKQRKRAPATVRRELTTLKAAVNYAAGQGAMITRKVFVWLPEKPEGKDRWLTRGEAARLLNAARIARSDVRLYLPLFILLGLYTGARKEAILSLKWPQIEMHANPPRINFGKDRDRTSKGRAHIPIPDPLMTFLKLAWKRRSSDIGPVVHDKGRGIEDIGDSTGGSFGTAAKRAGLEGVSPHTLRHTCGTWLAQAGVDLHKIGGWLGHTDTRTTALYAHHHPGYQEDARKAFNRRGR